MNLDAIRAISDKRMPDTVTITTPGARTPDGMGGYTRDVPTVVTSPCRLRPMNLREKETLRVAGKVINEGTVMLELPLAAAWTDSSRFAINGENYTMMLTVPPASYQVIRKIVLQADAKGA